MRSSKGRGIQCPLFVTNFPAAHCPITSRSCDEVRNAGSNTRPGQAADGPRVCTEPGSSSDLSTTLRDHFAALEFNVSLLAEVGGRQEASGVCILFIGDDAVRCRWAF